MEFEATATTSYSIIVPTRGRANDFARIAANFSNLPAALALDVVANRNFTTFTAGLTDRQGTRVFFVPGGGTSRARNIGMWVAETNIIVFIDDDVLPDMASLQTLVNRLQSSAATVATARVHSQSSDDLTSVLYQKFFSFDRGDTDCVFDNMSMISSPTVAWSMGVGAVFAVDRERLRAVPQPPIFDETLSNGRFCGGTEDVDFFLQCLQAGLVVEYCAKAVFAHEEAPGLSRLRAKMVQYARADGAFYAKWRSMLDIQDVLADVGGWAKRVMIHTERRLKGEISLPMVALLREPVEKALGAIWWSWRA